MQLNTVKIVKKPIHPYLGTAQACKAATRTVGSDTACLLLYERTVPVNTHVSRVSRGCTDLWALYACFTVPEYPRLVFMRI